MTRHNDDDGTHSCVTVSGFVFRCTYATAAPIRT